MAHEATAMKKLEDQLNCSVCLDTYTDPKQLQCHHVYCRKCLVRLVDRDQQGQLMVTCPTCRQATPVPANGVAGLQSAFNITPILEIRESFKKLQDNMAATLEGAVGGASSPDPAPDKPSLCSEHGDRELELYCETCGQLICSHCALKGGKHHSHDYELLHQAFEKYREEITPSLEEMKRQLTAISEALKRLDARCGEISDQAVLIEAEIRNSFRCLHQSLEVRETELIGQLHRTIQEKLKSLAAQRDQIETTQVQWNSCLEFMQEKLESNRCRQVLMMKVTEVGKKVKELPSTFQPDMLEPNTEADISFSAASADMTAMCQNYGQVSAASSPDPSQCHATVKDVEGVGEKCTALLQMINFKGQPCRQIVRTLESELVSDITGTRTRSGIKRRGESQYEISYQLTVKGRHQLHIKVEGQHIRRSPFRIMVKSSVEKLGTPLLTLGEVKNPRGVAINQRGEVVVTEWSGHCVSVYSPSGEKIRKFGTHGSDQGEFYHPHGVVVDGEGNVLVMDSGNHRIQKFTAGHFLAAVDTKGLGSVPSDEPCGIAYNASNNKVYLTNGLISNYHIKVLNSDLTYCSVFGKAGSGMGQFAGVCGVACDSTGKVYVTDFRNHNVQVFTAKGKFLRMFGQRDHEGHGELNRPIGITVDTNDLVYVSEYHNHRVSVFTSGGQFVTSFGRKGSGPGEFIFPVGIAVDNSGVVYVCDSGNNRVQIF